jgi:high-affinity iron transporter
MLHVLAAVIATQTGGTEGPEWDRAVGLLEYIGGDYRGAIESKDADELAEQKGLANEIVLSLKPASAGDLQFLSRAEGLSRDIANQASADSIERDTKRLADDIVTSKQLIRAPKVTPSLEDGARVFEAHCSRCHGADGRADTAMAQALKPPPANFHSAERMASVTPYKVFNTTRYGIPQTSMVPIPSLTDSERWNVSFYALSLRHRNCDNATFSSNNLTLDTLATQTDNALTTAYPDANIACLRTRLPAANAQVLSNKAVAGIDEALRHAESGDFPAARKRLVDVYLTDIEPLEPALKVKNPALLKEIEIAFTAARSAAEAQSGLTAPAERLKRALLQTQSKGPAADFWSVFVAALLILLREGFEATVVVGALLAVLKKMNATTHTRLVHLGWSSALVVGALLFVFAERFFAGANREWMESLVALAAVGMLLYAALWLNARSTMSSFMTDLRGKMKSALSQQSAVGLFFIAFSSVARESVETVLFLQGLSTDSRSGVVWGTVAGLAVLLALVVFVRTVGFVLPMKALFSASTAVLLVTAVALLGKGLHGLQELDIVSFRPVWFVEWPMFGIFPDLVTLLSQTILTLGILVFLYRPKSTARTAAATSTGASAASGSPTS